MIGTMLYLYGGLTNMGTTLDQLWSYNIIDKQWTWIGGHANGNPNSLSYPIARGFSSYNVGYPGGRYLPGMVIHSTIIALSSPLYYNNTISSFIVLYR